MDYRSSAIPETQIPRAAVPLLQHALDTYASETNKVVATWAEFRDDDLAYLPHPKSASVGDILKHQLLSERRFFAAFLGTPEPEADSVLPDQITVQDCCTRLVELAYPRLRFLAQQDEPWWQEERLFFDTRRQRIWIFWRRVLHTAHHRTQLTVYLRLLDRTVPATYGPTADVTWTGADPTTTVDAARRS